jgi:flagellar biosynthetic protein FlhB
VADQPAQERTERPTPRRLAKAREEGQIPRSQELLAATVLLTGAAAVAATGPWLGRGTGETLQQASRWLAMGPIGPAEAATVLRDTLGRALLTILPILGAVVLSTVLVGGLQARGVLSWQPVAPQLSRLSPLKGLKRLLGFEGLFTLAKAIVKLTILGAITYAAIVAAWPAIAALTGAEAGGVIAVTRSTVLTIAAWAGLAFLALSLVDYAFASWRHAEQLKMTRQEIVQEFRETEGDPLLKSRIRSLAQQMGRRRMLQQVREADVVIVNPTHLAVALRYDVARSAAPVVVAMGRRKLAERIRAIATESGVPIVRNVGVARALMATAKVGQPVPPALYAAIAEILAYVYRLRGGAPTIFRREARA